MPTPRIRIVHISDLHLGKESRQPWRMRRVLGSAWEENLKAIADDGPVDLLCFTGDVAQAGKAEQYAEAQEFVHTALEILRLPPERFFCVPGNHDIDRGINKPAWESMRKAIGDAERGAADGISNWMDGGAVPSGFQAEWRDAVLARQAAYQAWLAQIGRSALQPGPGLLGWRVSLDVGLATPLHLIGLDSAWLAGDDNDATKLLLTADQIGRLCTDEHGARLNGPLIALMHHPFDELADGREGRRLLAEHGVSLILHGHLHEPEHARWDTPSQGLHLSAAGCLYEGTKFPNSLQVLDLAIDPPHTLQPQQLWARAWSARGHWHDDDSLYPGSQNGRLLLAAPAAPTMPLATDTFVGREAQLKALRDALLPANTQDTQAVVVCCAIEGMAGVGKTRLAEEFVTQHWLPHWGLPLEDGLAHHVVRLALSSEGQPPSTQDLAQTVADRLRLAGPTDSVFERVAKGLRHGPQGKPRLLWLDNVDTQALADAVAPLRHHLRGCPLLVTARFQRLGTKDWQRVPVKPMEDEEALRLLQSQLDEQASSRLKPAEALALVRRLGGLPLALHIAASHLNLGLTPQSFIQALETQGLGLAPGNADDPALLADHARAIIRHSFALSWQHWCAHHAPEWQHALVALAHGPAADVGPSLAAAITGLADEVWQRLAPAAQRLSLLQVDATTQRISLHPLIAEFLRSQPGADSAEVQQRMGAWFLPRLPETGDATQGQAWGAIWAEPQALAHWLDGLPKEQALAVERAAKDLAVIQGPFGTWRKFLERLRAETAEPEHLSNLFWTLCQVARHAGDPAAALAYADEKAGIDEARGDARERALALGARADILEARGQLDEALRIRQEEELPVYQQLGDVRSLAVTKGQIADILQARGQLDEALRIRQEEQLPVYQQLGDVRSLAVAKGKIADILRARGQLDEALRIRQEEQLPVYQQLGDVRSLAMTKGQIADILQARGQLGEALRIRQEEELPVYQQLGDVRSLAVAKGKIADILQARGQLDEALRIRQEEELPVYQQLGDVRELAVAKGQIADILQARGQLDEALRIRQEEQLPVYQQLGDVRELAVTKGQIADILQARGQLGEALRILQEELLSIFQQLGDVRSLAVAKGKIAGILQARGQLDEALRIRQEEQLPIFQQLGDVRSILVCQTNVAQAMAQRGHIEDGPEIARLLLAAHAPAQRLGLPEAAQIEGIFQKIFGRPLPPVA